MKVLDQSLDLKQVLQLERAIVSGMRDVVIIEARFQLLGIRCLRLLKFLWCVFPGRVP